MKLLDLFSPTPLEAEIEKICAAARKLPGAIHVELLGSALYLENPNDIDIGVLVKDFNKFMQDRLAEGWETTGDYSMSGTDWGSIRLGKINMIVMADPDRMERFHLAMQVCKYLNLTEKKDRIAVCQIVRDKVDTWQVNIPADFGELK